MPKRSPKSEIYKPEDSQDPTELEDVSSVISSTSSQRDNSEPGDPDTPTGYLETNLDDLDGNTSSPSLISRVDTTLQIEPTESFTPDNLDFDITPRLGDIAESDQDLTRVIVTHRLLSVENREDQEEPHRTNMSDSFQKVNGLKCGAIVLVTILVTITAVLLSSIHRIEEGNVGVYFKYGALMNETTQPGIQYMTPFVVDVIEVQTRPQTDSLPTIISVTRDGIENTFKDVQVISRVRQEKLVPLVRKFGIQFRESLIFDRVKEELRIFCANNTIDDVYNTKFLEIVGNVEKNLISSIERLGEGGIEILNLVISKPDIPEDIAFNYKQVSYTQDTEIKSQY